MKKRRVENIQKCDFKYVIFRTKGRNVKGT